MRSGACAMMHGGGQRTIYSGMDLLFTMWSLGIEL